METILKSTALRHALSALALSIALPATATPTAIDLIDTGRTDHLGRHILTGGAELLSGYDLAIQTGPNPDVYVASLRTPGKERRAAFFVRDANGVGIGVGTRYLDTRNQTGDYSGELMDWRRIDRDIDGDGVSDTEYLIGDDENGFVVQLIDGIGVAVDARGRRDIYCQSEQTNDDNGAITQDATFWLPDMDARMGYVGLRNTQASPTAPWETLSLQVLASDWGGNGELMKLPASSRQVSAIEAEDQNGRAFLLVDDQPHNSFSGSGGACGRALNEGNVAITLQELQPSQPRKQDLQDLLIKINYTLSGDWAGDYSQYADYTGGTDTWILLTGSDNQNRPIAWLGKVQEGREFVGENSARLRYLFTPEQIDSLVPGNSYQLSAFMEVTVNLREVDADTPAEKRLTKLVSLTRFTIDDGSGAATPAAQ